MFALFTPSNKKESLCQYVRLSVPQDIKRSLSQLNPSIGREIVKAAPAMCHEHIVKTDKKKPTAL